MGAEPQTRKEQPGELTLQLGADVDDEQLDAMTASVRRQLLELDVEDVKRVPAGAAPEGARVAETFVLGALLVKLANRQTLEGVVGVMRSWLGGRPDRTAKLRFGDEEVEFTGLTADQQERLLASWLERGAGA